MKFITVLGIVSSMSVEAAGVPKMPKMGQEMVDFINGDDSIPFMAKLYSKFEGKTKKELNNFLGLLPDPNIRKAKAAAASKQPPSGLLGDDNGLLGGLGNLTSDSGSTTSAPGTSTSTASLPLNFTLSDKWGNCDSVFTIIQDQSNCGDCWAVSTASVIQDRRCIVYNAPQGAMSSWDLTSCCSACQGTSGNGCEGGYPTEAFNYYINSGVVSGGIYGSNDGCKPYQVASGAQNEPSDTNCSATCEPSYSTAYSVDKKHGATYQVFSNDTDGVMHDIYNYGPVVATFAVYEDFYQYSTGVYQYTTGQLVGYHAVRVVGWGETSTGVKYWRVANSWGTSWGMGGFFDIVRGTDNCDFESGIVSGTALKD